MKDWTLVDKWIGYVTKPDQTNSDPRVLIRGSQNVRFNDEDKIVTRPGYEIDAEASGDTTPVLSPYDFRMNTGGVRNLKKFDTKIQVRYQTSDGTTEYLDLMTGLTATAKMRADAWWNNTERLNLMLFVLGDANVYEWSGAIATFASMTATEIVINETISTSRFLTAGTRQIRVRDSGGTWRTFTYNAQVGSTFTVTSDPTIYTFDVDAPVMQEVRTNTNQPSATNKNHSIRVLENQAYIGNEEANLVFVSQNDTFLDYTFSTPRAPGEGAQITLDAPFTAFAKQDQAMFVSAGYSDWFKIFYEQIALGTTLSEQVKVKKLKTANGQAAFSQDMCIEVGNQIAFMSQTQELLLFGDLENLQNPQIIPLSDAIKPDFDAEDFTGGHLFFFKNQLRITAPNNSRTYINEWRSNAEGVMSRFWNPPQILPFRCYAIIDDLLYAHSAQSSDTFIAEFGTNDNGNGMLAKAVTAYRNFGNRASYKWHDEFYLEGYMQANTTLLVTHNYDFGGYTDTLEEEITGTDPDIFYETLPSADLGDDPLGDESLSGDITDEETPPKFRTYIESAARDYHEIQEIYQSDGIDQVWQILASGYNAHLSNTQPVHLKR